jgi:hypothetical protein
MGGLWGWIGEVLGRGLRIFVTRQGPIDQGLPSPRASMAPGEDPNPSNRLVWGTGLRLSVRI